MRCRIEIRFDNLYTLALDGEKELVVTIYYYNNHVTLHRYKIASIMFNQIYDTNNKKLLELLNMKITEIVDLAKQEYYLCNSYVIGGRGYLDDQVEKFGKIDLSLYEAKEKNYKLRDLCLDKLNWLIICDNRNSSKIYFDIEC